MSSTGGILRELVAVALGITLAMALWVVLRPMLLELPPGYILFASQETMSQRLFVYAVFSVGAITGALVAHRWRADTAAALAGTLAYFGLIFTIEQLLVNPDYWKLVERGYLARGDRGGSA